MTPRSSATVQRPFTVERFLAASPRVRAATDADLPFCWDMLHEAAIASPIFRGRPMADVLARPGVASYLTGWGRPGDLGLVAVSADGTALGAVWQRVSGAAEPGAGIQAPAGVPELILAVRRAHRGVGVGSTLLAGLAARARAAGYERLAASVDPLGGSIRFFRRHGFVEAGRRVGPDGVRLLLIGEIG